MQLDWIQLLDFRSYEEYDYRPAPDVNVLIGPNGAGKTNLLEAIGYLGSLKSIRGAPDAALRRIDTEATVLRGEITEGEHTSLVELELGARRRVQVNRQRLARSADILDVAIVVPFQPDDLDIVKRGPSLRRDFLDALAIQLAPGALLDQQEYDKAVRQRNALLRQDGRYADISTLAVWDERMSQAGARVVARRARAVETLEEHVTQAYEHVAERPSPVSFEYRSTWNGSLSRDVDAVTQQLAGSLEAARQSDMDRRVTTVGPHRDDPVVRIDGRDSRLHASQGEQRTLVLALRLASHRGIEAVTGRRAMLLLDDVFSELDIDRARALAAHLPDAQTFITTARSEEVPVAGEEVRIRG